MDIHPQDAVPLYHQLAEALRYRIATGELRPGTLLPSLRDGAAQWGVNLHTVRHAYAALVQHGLVRVDRRGTVVLEESAPGQEVDAFLDRVVREGRRLGLGLAELRRGLARYEKAASADQITVLAIECSETQAADLAGQLEAAFAVHAEGWSLERPAEPPADATLVATYFHYNDLRVRWPDRFAAVQFAAIRPDPRLAAELAASSPAAGGVPVAVVEREPTMAAAIAADLHRILPSDRFDLQPVTYAVPAAALIEIPEPTRLVFAPRVWANLSPADRASSRVYEARYLFDPRDLAEVGRRMGWRAYPRSAWAPPTAVAV